MTVIVNQLLTITLHTQLQDKDYSFTMPYGCASGDAISAFNELGKTLMQMATPPPTPSVVEPLPEVKPEEIDNANK